MEMQSLDIVNFVALSSGPLEEDSDIVTALTLSNYPRTVDHLDNDTNKVMAMAIIQKTMKNDSFISTADKMVQQVVKLVLGVLGNIASVVSFFAPVTTFIKIFKGKSVFEYRPLPYIVSLLNQLIWLYYGCLLAQGGIFIIIVSGIGCLFQAAYIGIFLYYAAVDSRRHAIRLLFIFIGGFSGIFLLTFFFIQTLVLRESIVGSFCVVISVASFAAPLTTVWQVVKTKSVEFMPLALTLSLTFNASMWLAYGIATADIYIEIPNAMGIMLGVGQMMVYAYYRYTYGIFHTFMYISDAFFDILSRVL